MASDGTNNAMFSAIEATVNNDWLKEMKMAKCDFMMKLKEKGVDDMILKNNVITINCSLEQLQDIHQEFVRGTPGSEKFEEFLIDEDIWIYIKQVYAKQIDEEKERLEVSLDTCINSGVVNIVFKSVATPKISSASKPKAVQKVEKQLGTMKEYISTLGCLVQSSVVVDSVDGRLLSEEDYDRLSEHVAALQDSVALSRSENNTIKIIGELAFVRKVKQFYRARLLSSPRKLKKNFESTFENKFKDEDTLVYKRFLNNNASLQSHHNEWGLSEDESNTIKGKVEELEHPDMTGDQDVELKEETYHQRSLHEQSFLERLEDNFKFDEESDDDPSMEIFKKDLFGGIDQSLKRFDWTKEEIEWPPLKDEIKNNTEFNEPPRITANSIRPKPFHNFRNLDAQPDATSDEEKPLKFNRVRKRFPDIAFDTDPKPSIRALPRVQPERKEDKLQFDSDSD